MMRIIFTLFIYSCFFSPSAHAVPEGITKSGLAPLPWEAKTTQIKVVSLKDILSRAESELSIAKTYLKEIDVAEGKRLSARGAFDTQLRARYSLLGESYEQRVVDLQLSKQIDSTPFRVFGGWRNGDGEFRPYEGKELTGSQGEWRAGISLPLLRGLLIDPGRAEVKTSRLSFDATQASSRFDIFELKSEIAERYWESVGAFWQLESVYRLYQLAITRGEQVRTRVSAGGAAKIEMTEAERTIIQRKIQLIESERNYQKAMVNLSLYFKDLREVQVSPILLEQSLLSDRLKLQTENLDVETELTLSPEKILVKATDSRLDLKSLNHKIDSAEVDLKLARNKTLPHLDSTVEYAMDRGEPKDQEKEMRVSVLLTFPLENRQARGERFSQQARVDLLEQKRVFLKEKIQQQVNDVISAVRASALKLRATLEDVELSEKLAQAERTRFQNGMSSLLIVNLREQAANDSALKALSAKVEFEKLKVRLSLVKGEDPGAI
jgi:cobalt-zinc-cadmium efflux system outer membrane protein